MYMWILYKNAIYTGVEYHRAITYIYIFFYKMENTQRPIIIGATTNII